jgi:hypothetical protein
MLLKECLEVYTAFQKLSSTDLPLKSSWMIAQNISKLKPIVQTFETERDKYIHVLQSKAEVDDAGNPVVTDELSAEFAKQIDELMNEDQKVRLKKVTLIDDGQLSIEPKILLAALDYIILKDDGNKTS